MTQLTPSSAAPASPLPGSPAPPDAGGEAEAGADRAAELLPPGRARYTVVVHTSDVRGAGERSRVALGFRGQGLREPSAGRSTPDPAFLSPPPYISRPHLHHHLHPHPPHPPHPAPPPNPPKQAPTRA
jgi:hypothetical protein